MANEDITSRLLHLSTESRKTGFSSVADDDTIVLVGFSNPLFTTSLIQSFLDIVHHINRCKYKVLNLYRMLDEAVRIPDDFSIV